MSIRMRGVQSRPSWTVIRGRIVAKARPLPSGCWQWHGAVSAGYGRIGWCENGKGKVFLAHRVAYEAWREPIPAGLHIDHSCENRLCVNPVHLVVRTQAEHNARHQVKEACPQGHPYSEDAKTKEGSHYCRICSKLRMRAKKRPCPECGELMWYDSRMCRDCYLGGADG